MPARLQKTGQKMTVRVLGCLRSQSGVIRSDVCSWVQLPG